MLQFNFKSNKTILGFNTGHHGGCAIIHDDKIIAISEERLTRKKYTEGYLNSFFYCLSALGLKVDDIDLFVSSSYHKTLPNFYFGDFKSLGLKKNKFITVDHHLSHAYNSYFLSPFNKALIVVIDGLGNDTDTESYYIGDGNRIKKIGGNDPERSIYKGIGRAYEVFTNFCGWSSQEAGKTMGLAPYGRDKYPNIELYKLNDKMQVESYIEGKYFHGAMNFIKHNKINFGKNFSGFENKDAAFFVQDRTEKIIIKLINKLYDKYQIENLCLSGGVFLNCIINRKILEQTKIKKIFIPPCCDDTGESLGNALWGYHSYFHKDQRFHFLKPYLGRNYSELEIKDVLEKKQKIFTLPYEIKSKDFKSKKSKNIAKDVAKILAKGKIVGWFQDGSEIGPRALGNRSILCAPFPAKMKDVLNNKIKHREWFRPFAPAILEEHLSAYFDLDKKSPYMLMTAHVNRNKLNKVSATIHVDGTARIQTVSKRINDRFYNLITEFYKITDIPVLLNTSFNDSGEPIVETPKDALLMFCKTPLDFLVLGDYLIWKT